MDLQIGFDNFGKVRANNLNFIDKTLFIKEVLDNKSVEVSVITRPRRFGKTFNLSTLHYFLAAEVNGQKTSTLFDNLKITKVDNGAYTQYQGKSPVIFISFKGITSQDYAFAYEKLYELIIKTFNEHKYLKQSNKVSEGNLELFKIIVDRKANRAQIENSLQILTECLFEHYGVKSWLLIDEYDTPIQSGYLHGYYDAIVEVIRGMFGAALKSNPYLERSVITGILRVAKESLFSDVNNLTVYSLLQSKYSQYFGFTGAEVSEVLNEANLSNKEQDIKTWYNGYDFGGTTVYNPWSIASCLGKKGILQPYWVNTSGNDLIRDLIVNSNNEFKAEFEKLLQDKTITKDIDENMVFGELKQSDAAAWSLLLMSGYLKVIAPSLEAGNTTFDCAIPNLEVKTMYRTIIQKWLGNGHGMEWYQEFLRALLSGNIPKFSEMFGEILIRTMSSRDTNHNPEAFYHGFMLGLVAGLDQAKYEIKSNRESGDGFYDIAIMPRDIQKPAVILEIKSVTPPEKMAAKKLPAFLDKTLTKSAHAALAQINRLNYMRDIVQRGFADIIKIGLAFSGKEFQLKAESSVFR